MVSAVAFSPEGKTLASGAGDGLIFFWDPLIGVPIKLIHAQPSGVAALAYSPHGRLLASAGRDSTIKIWDATSGNELRALKGHVRDVHSLAFSPDGTLLAAGDDYGEVILWAGEDWSIKRRFSPVTSERYVDFHTVSFSADGTYLAAFSHRLVMLWEVGTGRIVRSVRLPPSPSYGQLVIAGAISSDGHTLVTTTSDRGLHLYNTATGKENSVVVSPGDPANYWWGGVSLTRDGTLVAVAINKAISVWAMARKTGQPPSLRWQGTSTDLITHVAVSPDGKWLA